MSMWIQISVGLVPAFLILLLYMMMVRRNIMSTCCVLLMLAAGICSGIYLSGDLKDQNFKKSKQSSITVFNSNLNQVQTEESLQIIGAIAANGDIQGASRMLRQTIKENGYTEACALTQARIYAVSKNYVAAMNMYEKSRNVWDDFAAREFEAVNNACGANSVDSVLLSHMDDASAAVQLFDKVPAKGSLLEAEIQVSEYLKESTTQESNDYGELSHILTTTNLIYESFLMDGKKNDAQIHSLELDLEQWEKQNPEVFSLKQVKNARMKLQILQGHYSEIAYELTETSDYSEIMIASQLYLSGYVEKSDFSGPYAQTDDASLRAVTDRLKELKGSKDETLSGTAEELLNIYKEYETDAPLYKMEQALLACALDPTMTDSSKIYLQAAKIELKENREDKAREYIGLAMDTTSDCEDTGYTGPMYQIMSIMANKDEAESLKNVALYTNRVLNNQLDIVVPENTGSLASEQTDFSGYVTDYVSMKRSAVNIMSLDPSQFEQVTAYVQIETAAEYSPEELKKLITIEDCGVQIQDYALEKVSYNTANMLLCCDVSGSMSGNPIEDSRAAISNLADSMTGDTLLGIALFNHSAEGVTYFTREPEQIRQAAELMNASGGTNIYDTVIQGLDSFPMVQNAETLNTLVIMSDGRDGGSHSIEKIESEIGALARKRSILIHCLGLGPDVDANYLQSIAQSAGGTYQYITDPSSLSLFYQNLASQKNYTYKLQYTAEDTLSADRQLRVSLNDSEFLYDIETYTVPGMEGTVNDGQSDLIYSENLSIRGLDTRFLFKSVNPASVKLLGTGFKPDDSIAVTMVMNNGGTYGISYDITPMLEGEESYKLTIPSSVACGVYDMRVTINGKTAILNRELTVQVQGSEQTTAFGPYVFTSYQKDTLDGQVMLDGYVTMNNWLCFKGEVRLQGNLKDAKIMLEDHTGSYIRYYSDRSKGLADLMRRLNMVLPIPPLDKLTLYNDIAHQTSSDDYLVDTGIIPTLSFKSVFTLASPGYSLYPDRLKIDAVAFDTKFPFQDKLIAVQDEDWFHFEVEELQGILTPDNIGIVFDFKIGKEEGSYKPVNVLGMPLRLRSNGNLKADTLKNEYEIDFNTSVLFFGDGDLGLTIKWEDNIIPKKVMLKLPIEKTVIIGGVPVTFDKFELGVDDLDVRNLLNTTMVGKMDASACSVQALVPQVKKYIKDDISLIKLEDSKLSLRVENFLIEAETTVKLLEEIELANAKLQIGNFSYTNELLGMDSEAVSGVNGKIGLGITFIQDNCEIDLSGTGEVTLTNRFVGLKASGDSRFLIQWWCLIKEFSAKGLATIGYYEDHDRVGAFVIRFRGYDNKGKQGDFSMMASQNGLYLGEKKVF